MTPTTSPRKVLVLGAGGFLGAHVVRELLATDAEVFAGVRSNSPPLFDDPRVTPVVGDLTDIEYVRRAVDGMDAVIFTAGRTWEAGLPLEDYDRLNTGITRTFFEALGERKNVRAVFTSSTSTIGGTLEPIVLNEDSGRAAICEKLLSPYDRAKVAAENVALDYAARGYDVVVLNPGFMLGPGAAPTAKLANPYFVLSVCRKQCPFYIESLMTIVDVRDVAVGHVAALTRGERGRRYIVGGRNMSRAEFYPLLTRLTGVACPPQLPGWALNVLATGFDTMEYMSFGLFKTPIHRSFAKAAILHYCADSQRAVDELGYKIRPLEETLLDMLRDYYARGQLPAELGFVPHVTVDNAPRMMLLRQVAAADTHAKFLLKHVAKLYDACEANFALRDALTQLQERSKIDSKTGRYVIDRRACKPQLNVLAMFFEHVYFSSSEFLAEVL